MGSDIEINLAPQMSIGCQPTARLSIGPGIAPFFWDKSGGQSKKTGRSGLVKGSAASCAGEGGVSPNAWSALVRMSPA